MVSVGWSMQRLSDNAGRSQGPAFIFRRFQEGSISGILQAAGGGGMGWLPQRREEVASGASQGLGILEA